MSNKPGVKPKDGPISDNFNPRKAGVNAKDIEQAQQQTAPYKAFQRKDPKDWTPKYAAKVAQAARSKARKEAREAAALPIPSLKSADNKETQDAQRMLQDMLWVYGQVNGREKLLKMVQADKTNKEFVFVAKELIKVQTALLTAQIRAKSEGAIGGNKVVFVVLKGLGDTEERIGVPFENLNRLAIGEGSVTEPGEGEDGGQLDS